LGIPELALLTLLTILFSWTIYNLPILARGLAATLRHTASPARTAPQRLPTFSIVVAAKNEEKVIGRLLQSLLQLDYPREKMQIVVVEDGSSDRTPRICEDYAHEHQGLIEFHHRELSQNKPAALNHALTKTRGEIVAIFDADNVLEKDLLLRAAAHFQDDSVVAIQGQTHSINENQNLIAKLQTYDQEGLWKTYLQGKDSLGLFVPFTGSCGFIRREILLKCGGWDERSLTEDAELAARLAATKHRVRYAPDVQTWQENVSSLRQLVKQRRRWFRGYMETLVKYGGLLTQKSLIGLDVEATLMGPLIVSICFLTNIISIYGIIAGNSFIGRELVIISSATGFLTRGTIVVCGTVLLYQLKPRRLRNLLWIGALIMYWELQMAIAFYTSLCFLLRRPQLWEKTDKTGAADATIVESIKTESQEPRPEGRGLLGDLDESSRIRSARARCATAVR
jgi:cellulose synthase/poly-beta-1,6-N-acetylglucosamine synthase-like glycosyltransferase